MTSKRIATIIGARPQFIKVAPVSKALAATGTIKEVLIHTGQHYDVAMSDVFFDELGIAAPDHNLSIHGGGHGAMTGAMMQKLEPVLEQIAPDMVLIYGDTNSTLAGALVASKLHIPIAHVEAGLRSFNRKMPEEINRIVADQLSTLLFASTGAAVQNLRNEGIAGDRVHSVGDVMFDATLQIAERAKSQSDILQTLNIHTGNYVLATLHRAENTDDQNRLRSAVEALDEIAADLPVILPLHPRTAARMKAAGLSFSKVQAIPPIGYLEMAALEAQAALIVTDSGGVQKEAFFHKIPCVTLRDETEWVELIDLGWNRLAPPGSVNLTDTILAALGQKGTDAMPYGDGHAAEAIASILAR